LDETGSIGVLIHEINKENSKDIIDFNSDEQNEVKRILVTGFSSSSLNKTISSMDCQKSNKSNRSNKSGKSSKASSRSSAEMILGRNSKKRHLPSMILKIEDVENKS
jgi:hypothetical protein